MKLPRLTQPTVFTGAGARSETTPTKTPGTIAPASQLGGGFGNISQNLAPGVGRLVNDEGDNWCTGTLVGSKYVLTAAHCAGLNNFQYGYDSLYNSDVPTYKVVAFQQIEDTDDIALVKLDKVVKNGQVRQVLANSEYSTKTPFGVLTSGYPAGLGKDGQQFTIGGTVTNFSKQGVMTVEYDNGGGLSGAAVTRGGMVIGVHQKGNPKHQITSAESLSETTVMLINELMKL